MPFEKLVTTTEVLEKHCQAIEKAQYITVDTEFLREKTYYPQLCLIQVAGPESDFAVDTLAPGIDLKPLFKLFNNKNILKVFHSARQDLEIIYKLTKKIPHPLFDTQVAAMVCGFGEAASYETLVRKLAEAEVDKSARFTDWSHRPLTEKQVRYALSDVTYLRTVYEKLVERLDETGRSHWLKEEMEVLTDPATYSALPEEVWQKIRLRGGKSVKFIKRVQGLAKWREEAAQTRDLPRNHVLKEQILLEIAASAPKTIDALSNIRGFSKKMAESAWGKEILDIIHHVDAIPAEELEKDPVERPKAVKNSSVAELLKVLLRIQADEHDVAAKLIADSDDITIIASEKKPDVPAMHGWRYEVFGQYAIALKEGKIALTAHGNKMKMVEL